MTLMLLSWEEYLHTMKLARKHEVFLVVLIFINGIMDVFIFQDCWNMEQDSQRQKQCENQSIPVKCKFFWLHVVYLKLCVNCWIYEEGHCQNNLAQQSEREKNLQPESSENISRKLWTSWTIGWEPKKYN